MPRFNVPLPKSNSPRGARSRSPLMVLFGLLALAVVLAFVPARYVAVVRSGWREVLRPGQAALSASGDFAQARWQQFRHGNQPSTEDLAAMQARIAQLEQELLLARSERGELAALAGGEDASLVQLQTVPARVLGQQAKSFLEAREVLNLGSRGGIQAEALVVDQGNSANLQPGQVVLAGTRVWGKVAEVSPHTSTVRRATDAGYRDLVQLATPRADGLQFAARGMLVGTGGRQCRIELVETTAPVNVGDYVYTADDGVLGTPLLYGRVAKLERPPGASHWQIWMDPAVSNAAPPSRVAVLTLAVNPTRMAENRKP